MKIKLECPNAEYVEGMKIHCKAVKGRCAHVYFKACKGWWALTPQAARCPMREDQNGK